MIIKIKTNSGSHHQSIVIKILSLLVFGSFCPFSYSQPMGHHATIKKWSVCLQSAGSTCGNSSCHSDFETWSRKYPCELYGSYHFVDNHSLKNKSKCCGSAILTCPTNPENGLITYKGYPVHVALDTFQLLAHCVDAEGNRNEQILVDFTAAIPTAWETVTLNLRVEKDSIVIDAFDGDSLPPYFKSSSKITLKYGQSVLSKVCAVSAVPFNHGSGMKSHVKAKVTTHFIPNPLKGQMLKFEMINEAALKDNIQFSFYDSMGELIFDYTPVEAEGEIDVSRLPNGVYTIVIHSDNSKESTKLVINR